MRPWPLVSPLPGSGLLIGPERYLPPGRTGLRADTHSASLPDDPHLEPLLRSMAVSRGYHQALVSPIIRSRACGRQPWTIAPQPTDRDFGRHGAWFANYPPLVPGRIERPAPELSHRVVATTPHELVARLAAATNASVSRIRHSPACHVLTQSAFRQVQATQRRAFLTNVAGTSPGQPRGWCIGAGPFRASRHPASGLVQALVPIPHLAEDALALELAATLLADAAGANGTWSQPGHR